MGRIFYLMGKSASGKDTLYKKILERTPGLETVILYTTRPMREGEQEGVEYYFTTPEQLMQFEQQGKLIEMRTYQTMLGPWSYATVDDGQINLDQSDYLVMGTLESYGKLRAYFGDVRMVPLYVTVDDGVRLMRALDRERQQAQPKYKELCRRYLADEADFSPENLRRQGITVDYNNEDLEACLRKIIAVVEQ